MLKMMYFINKLLEINFTGKITEILFKHACVISTQISWIFLGYLFLQYMISKYSLNF